MELTDSIRGFRGRFLYIRGPSRLHGPQTSPPLRVLPRHLLRKRSVAFFVRFFLVWASTKNQCSTVPRELSMSALLLR